MFNVQDSRCLAFSKVNVEACQLACSANAVAYLEVGTAGTEVTCASIVQLIVVAQQQNAVLRF